MHLVLILSWVCGMTITSHCATRYVNDKPGVLSYIQNNMNHENFNVKVSDEKIDLWVPWKAKCLRKQFSHLLNERCGMVKFWITTKVGKCLYMQPCINTYFFHDDVTKWKHFPRYWPFVRGIHRSPVNSLHKGQWRGALMFSLICLWINSWENNR